MSTPENLTKWNALREQRQALRDQHYKLTRKPEPMNLRKASAYRASIKRLEDKMDAIDKKLRKLSGASDDWRTDTVPNP